ncbi:hypothetical protein JCGZ_20135 [Jatropha curcas]|uniref:Aminotransferase-like plant mobile domain-containing protein n=1 Tax=Jatropha curcas TaxID=180498 RepID=A0A067JUF0_JATCU|nr:hypothetical protein JCGZ_20135 [Jatropha curcas]
MASSDLSDEDFLGSLGISLDEVNVTANVDTHASVTGVYAQMARHNYKELLGALAERWWDTTNTFHFPWGEMTMTPTDFSVISRIPFGIRPIELYDDWRTEVSPDQMVELIGIDLPRIVGPGSTTPALSVSRRWKEKFNPSILKSLENLAHLEEYDWAGAILSRMYDDMCDLSRGHCKVSGTYYYWETWAFEYFPYTHPELIHADLGLVPLAWRWYRTNPQTALYRKSLRDLRTFFNTCTVGQAGAMNARLQSWIEADPHFRRSEALSRRSISYYTPDGTLAFREVSLENVDRLDLPPEDITEVPPGLVNQMMELMLGMQQ